MSEHYWPTEPGKYLIDTGEGYDDEWALSVDGKWVSEIVVGRRFSTLEMQNDGYLGVRREQASTPDLTALIREAIADFRANVKQPTKAADWAFKWANRFIEVVE